MVLVEHAGDSSARTPSLTIRSTRGPRAVRQAGSAASGMAPIPLQGRALGTRCHQLADGLDASSAAAATGSAGHVHLEGHRSGHVQLPVPERVRHPRVHLGHDQATPGRAPPPPRASTFTSMPSDTRSSLRHVVCSTRRPAAARCDTASGTIESRLGT